MTLPAYVIYQNETDLNTFYQQSFDQENKFLPTDHYNQSANVLKNPLVGFIPIRIPNMSGFSNEDMYYFFNMQKAKEILYRDITRQEICQTLAHINCWRMIAEDDTITDEDFALITESQYQLIPNIIEIATQYKNKYPSYGIILLKNNRRLHQDSDDIQAIVFFEEHRYCNIESGIYLIKKSAIKQILNKFLIETPFWLSFYFPLFYDYKNLAIVEYGLGSLPAPKKAEKFTLDAPLFSVIIPVYNVEKYLVACLDSVLQQDYDNYEIILVDDGSTDNSTEICLEYAQKYPQIQFIRKRNGGQADARNMGINIAQGKYLIFLDSDDFWERNSALTELKNIVQGKDLDLVTMPFCTFTINYFCDSSNLFPKRKDNLDLELLLSCYIYNVSACIKVIRRELVLENKIYFPKGMIHEDFAWSFDTLKYVNNYEIYDKPFYMYRVDRVGSTVNTPNENLVIHPLILIKERLEFLLTNPNLERKNILMEYLKNKYPSKDALPNKEYIYQLFDECERLWKLLEN